MLVSLVIGYWILSQPCCFHVSCCYNEVEDVVQAGFFCLIFLMVSDKLHGLAFLVRGQQSFFEREILHDAFLQELVQEECSGCDFSKIVIRFREHGLAGGKLSECGANLLFRVTVCDNGFIFEKKPLQQVFVFWIPDNVRGGQRFTKWDGLFEIVLKHVPDIFADTDSGRECERVGVCRCTFQRIRFHFKIQLGRCGKICCVGVDITVRCVISVMLGTVQSNKQDVMMLGSLCIIVLQDMDDFCVILFVCVIYFSGKNRRATSS